MRKYTEEELCILWHDIPNEKKNALTYNELCCKWGVNVRQVRHTLHELSLFDNGDDYVLVRSCKNSGFYKTNDLQIIAEYKNECLKKGKSVFAPVKKCNRILNADTVQFDFENNMRLMREKAGLKQTEVCKELAKRGLKLSPELLSKMENGWCVPNPPVLFDLARLYGCTAHEIINVSTWFPESV